MGVGGRVRLPCHCPCLPLTQHSRDRAALSPQGHRLSTGGLEEVLAAHPAVAECAVIGARDRLKGQVPVGLIVLSDDAAGIDEAQVVADVVRSVREEVGPVAAFRHAAVVGALPKTRSGKTLRGIIQSVADGDSYVLPGTIEDASAVELVEAALKGIGYPAGGA